MRITNRGILQKFKDAHPDASQRVDAWAREVEEADWKAPYHIKDRYPKASIVGGKNVVFDIRGGRYRLWVKVDYQRGIVFIKNAGTHEEYNKWEIK